MPHLRNAYPVIAVCLALGLWAGACSRDGAADPRPFANAQPAVQAAVARQESRLAEPLPAPPEAFRVARYTRYLDHLADPARRAVAREGFFRDWSDDPGDPFLIEIAVMNRRHLGRNAQRDSLLTVAAADTASAIHHFVQGRRGWGRSASAGSDFRQAGRLAAGRDPLLEVWAEARAARLVADAGGVNEAVERLADLTGPAWMRGGPDLATLVWSDLSLVARRAQHLDDALAGAVMAVRCADAAGGGYLQTRSRISLALAHLERGRHAAAFDTLEACYATARDSGYVRLRETAHAQMARVAHAEGNLERETKELRRMLEMTRASGDTNGVVLAGLAIVDGLRRKGDLEAAAALLDSTEVLHRVWAGGRLGGSIHEARAMVMNQLGHRAAAESLWTLAAAAADRPRGRSTALLAEVALIRQGLEIDRPGMAYRALARGQAMERENPAAARQADAGLHLALAAARLHARQGEYHLADAQLQRARGMISPADRQQQWFVAEAEGKVARLAGDLATAEDAFARGLALADSIGVPERVRRSRVDLGAVLLDAGRWEEAADLVAADLTVTSYWPRLNAHLITAMALSRGDQREAARTAFVAAERVLGTDPPADLAALLALERGRNLLALEEPDAALEHLVRARSALEDSAAAATDLVRSFGRGLRRDTAEALIGLYHDHPRRAPAGDAATAGRIAAAWADRRAPALARGPRIEFFVGRRRAFAWFSPDLDAPPAMTELMPSEELRSLAEAVTTDLAYPGREVAWDEARRLGGALLGPMAGAWDEGTTLEIAPDGFLTSLPWAALPWNGGDEPLLVHGPFEISVGAPVAARQAEGTDLLVAVGVDGGAGDDGPRLANAEAEARAIAASWPSAEVDLRLGPEGHLADLLDGELKACRALHIATHSRIYEGADGRSTIRMAGTGEAPLTVDEIMDANLRADLVYLSSCDGGRSHRSAGRGVASFAGAFLSAGARGVVASSVLVDDAAGRAMAEAFYRHWPAQTNRAAALRSALLEVREGDPRWSHPFYWGFTGLYVRPAN